MPDSYPDFLHHSQILSYLTQYGSHFDLFPHIRLGEEITHATKRGESWHVSTRSGHTYSAKHLIVCTGVHQQPADMSADPRFDGFSGTLVHGASVKQIAAEYTNKVVVVWGGGESAS